MTDGAIAASGPVVLTREGATLTVDPTAGARLASLVVDGHELLVTEGDGPIWWGCYPMAPFAGRIRDGRFPFRGRRYQLPLTMPPNAIHGTVLDRAWAGHLPEPTIASSSRTDLGPDWPFRGRVDADDRAWSRVGWRRPSRLEADEPMPVVLGWHPWFRRESDGVARPARVRGRTRCTSAAPDGLPTGAIGRARRRARGMTRSPTS